MSTKKLKLKSDLLVEGSIQQGQTSNFDIKLPTTIYYKPINPEWYNSSFTKREPEKSYTIEGIQYTTSIAYYDIVNNTVTNKSSSYTITIPAFSYYICSNTAFQPPGDQEPAGSDFQNKNGLDRFMTLLNSKGEPSLIYVNTKKFNTSPDSSLIYIGWVTTFEYLNLQGMPKETPFDLTLYEADVTLRYDFENLQFTTEAQKDIYDPMKEAKLDCIYTYIDTNGDRRYTIYEDYTPSKATDEDLIKLTDENDAEYGNMLYSIKLEALFNGENKYSLGDKDFSFVSGNNVVAIGKEASAAGHDSIALGEGAKGLGANNFIRAKTGLAIGLNNKVTGPQATALNEGNTASGYASLAFGNNTMAIGMYSQAGGYNTLAKGTASHAEGWNTTAPGVVAHAEGNNTHAIGQYSHTENYYTEAKGKSSHAEGNQSQALGDYSHAEGLRAKAIGSSSHAEGSITYAKAANSHAEGSSTQANGNTAHAEGYLTISHAEQSHSEGIATQTGDAKDATKGKASHAEGFATKAYGTSSHAEGSGVYAYVKLTGDLGAKTYNYPSSSKNYLAVGYIVRRGTVEAKIISLTNNTITLDKTLSLYYDNGPLNETCIVISGYLTAEGNYSHAEGYNTYAKGSRAHAEGSDTTASGYVSHAEGYMTEAQGEQTHAEGYYTKATSKGQHVEGRYNYLDDNGLAGDYAHIVGNGTATARSNAHTLDWNGNAWFAGKITLGNDNDEVVTKTFLESYTKKSASYTVEVDAKDWSGSDDTGYTQTIKIDKIAEGDDPIVAIVLGDDISKNDAALTAYECLTRVVTSDGTITLYANHNKPSSNFTIRLKVV